MKPTKKIAFVVLEYWDCGNEKHRHRTEEVAKRCVDRNANRKPLPSQEERTWRDIQIARKVINGAKMKAVAEPFGIGVEGVRHVVFKLLRRADRHVRETEDLVPAYSPYSPISEIRANKVYWLERIDKFVASHGTD